MLVFILKSYYKKEKIMTKIPRYVLLLTLSCLTPLTATADRISGNLVEGETYEGYSAKNGGAKWSVFETITSKGNTFKNNKSTGPNESSSSGGGVINDMKGTITVENGTFESNESAANGGAILLYQTSAGSITGSHFTSNTAATKGGALYLDSVNEKYTVSGSDFTSNSAAEGGAIYVTGKPLVFDGLTFKQNYASGDGGAVSVWPVTKDKSVKINNSTFEGNTADGRGGGLYAWGTIGAENTSFSKNSASQGGGIYITNGSTNILKEVTFKENNSKTIGGGIAASNSTIQINDGTFENNTAQTFGGAMSFSVTKENNYASSMGSSINIQNSDFIGNNAGQEGGALYVNIAPDAPGLMNEVKIVSNDGTTHKFSGNRHRVHASSGEKEEANAIYIEKGMVTLRTLTKEGSRLLFNDGIAGSSIDNAKLVIDGNVADGNVTFNDKVQNVNLTLKSGELKLNDVETRVTTTDAILDNVKLTLNSGKLNMKNGEVDTLNITDFTAKEDVSIAFDADLASGQSDNFNVSGTMKGGLKFDAEHFDVNLIDGDAEGFQLFNKLDSGFSLAGDSVVRYTNDVKYTMTLGENGFVNVARDNSHGLTDAISAEGVREYRPETPMDITTSGDLGEMKGEYLKIQLDNMAMDGNGNGGLIVGADQRLELANIGSEEDGKAATGFNSVNGGVVRGDAGSEVTIVNSSFVNNHAEDNGGAIWSEGVVNIEATEGNSTRFDGNTAADRSNAVYMADAASELNIKATNGTVSFNDAISGVDGYEINISGTENGTVNFNNDVENVGKVNIEGAQVYLDTDSRLNGAEIALNGGALHLDNEMISNLASFKSLSGGNGILHIDVDEANRSADQIAVENLSGTVNVIGHNISAKQTRIMPFADTNTNADQASGDQIKFAKVANPGDGNFNILRVENSAYEWNTVSAVNPDGSTDWLMAIKEDEQSGKLIVVSEAAAYLSLNAAGFEQTRDLVRNVENKVAATMTYSQPCCGYYDNAYNGKPLYNLWVSPTYSNATVKAPSRFEADIYGLEAGGDIQHDIHNRLGVFASYRYGKYDVNGENDYFLVTKSSDIEIDSYLAGLYYRYDKQNLQVMATVFGGMQKADIKTADGIKSDTDATQFGAAVSAGYGIVLPSNWTMEPQVGVSYTQIEWDDINDVSLGRVGFDTASQVELEAGVKFEKAWTLNAETAKFYVKPSIVQQFVDGDKVQLDAINGVDSLDDRTLGRVTGGLSYQLSDQLNVYGNVGYTFGSDYENISANVGLNWAF